MENPCHLGVEANSVPSPIQSMEKAGREDAWSNVLLLEARWLWPVVNIAQAKKEVTMVICLPCQHYFKLVTTLSILFPL